MPDSPSTPTRQFPVWETVVTFVALVSVWPAYVLEVKDDRWLLAFRIVCVLMLALMAFIFVRRMVAFHKLAREAEETRRKEAKGGKQERARLPWEPPTN